MKILLSILAICTFAQLTAQDETPEFGHVTLADFAATPFDPVSSSVVLFDKGIYGGVYQPSVERHIRVKVISKEAFGLWGDFELGDRFTRPNKVKAATHYIEDGKVVSHFVEKDEIKGSRGFNYKMVNLTNLREGCIIELSYRADQQFFFLPFWILQWEVPVLRSEFQVMSFGKFTYIIRGNFEPSHYDPKYKGRYNRWVFKNIPAFDEEPLMPDPINYFGRIEFWNHADSWQKVNEEYLEAYRRWLVEFEESIAKLKIQNHIDNVSDPLERVEIICRYIKENYKWTEYWSDSPQLATSIFQTKEGASGELNVLLYALLKKAGFSPDFVLLSTDDNGLVIKDLPSKDQFNYMLCALELNGKQYLLDATDPTLRFDIVPEYCINMDGLVISERGSRWIRIEGEIREKINVNAWLSISKNQNLKGKVTTVKQGYAAFKDRKHYNSIGESQFRKESIPNNLWVIDSTNVKIGKDDTPSVVTHYATIPGYITEANNKIYLNPYIMLTETANRLHGNIRVYPIDFRSKIEKRLLVNIQMPDGTAVESLPKSQSISLPDKSVACSFKITSDGRNIVVIYLFTIEKIWHEKEEFANLREFFNMVIAKQNEMIVLVKTRN